MEPTTSPIVKTIWNAVTELKMANEFFPVDPKNPIIFDKNIWSTSLKPGMVIPKDAFN